MFGILFFTIGTGSNKADAVSLENMIKNDSLISAADKLSYKAALKYAKKCNLGGYSDWRIPTIKELYSIIAEHTGNPYDKVEKDSDRDYWMTSAEALEYGMIDEVLSRQK